MPPTDNRRSIYRVSICAWLIELLALCFTHYNMKRKTRQEKLVEQIDARLIFIEKVMVVSANELSDAEFEALSKEAIKLRDMLRML
jgi:hypothetical protein